MPSAGPATHWLAWHHIVSPKGLWNQVICVLGVNLDRLAVRAGGVEASVSALDAGMPLQ